MSSSRNRRFQNTQQEEDGLTSTELKSKLIQVMKNRGILDSMKSQLRNKLVLELNPNLEQSKLNQLESERRLSTQSHKSNLALNTINCLIIDHLKSNQYDYTLSVFMPECGIQLNEVYALSDILHILKVSPESKLFQQLENSQAIKSKGLLWYLTSYFCSHYVTHEMSTQTEFDVHSIGSSLDFKLKNLDKQYYDMAENYSGKLTFDEKIIEYQKRLSEKSKLELQEKINEFKENELNKIRLEEREKLRAELQSYRVELDNAYKKRHDELNQREKSLDVLWKQKKEFEERELYMQRQNLFDEIRQLREREADLKRNFDNQLKQVQVDAKKYEKYEEELKKKESHLKQMENEMHLRLRDEKERIKLEVENAYAQREFILHSIDTKNKQEAVQIDLEKSHLDRMKSEFQAQQMRLNELDLQVQRATGETLCLKQENALLKEKLEHCLDYEFIKQENRMLKHKLNISKELIGEKSLSAIGVAASARSFRSRLDTQQQQQQQHQLPADYHQQRKRSVTFNEMPMNQEPSDKDNEENSMFLATEMGVDEQANIFNENLKLDLNNKEPMSERDKAIEEGERILSEALDRVELKDKLEHHNLVNRELKDLYEMQIYEQRKLEQTINEVKKQVEFICNGVSVLSGEDDQNYGKRVGKNNSNDISLEFIDKAKDRLRYLEVEGERVEQSYRNYQQHVRTKYYPLNDPSSTHQETNKRNELLDLERFIESTLKTNANVKLLKEQLQSDYEQYAKMSKVQEKTSHLESEYKNVDELIRNVKRENRERVDLSSMRENLLHEQVELSELNKKRADLFEDDSFNQIRTSTNGNKKYTSIPNEKITTRNRYELATNEEEEDEDEEPSRNPKLNRFGLANRIGKLDLEEKEIVGDDNTSNLFTDRNADESTSKINNNKMDKKGILNEYVSAFKHQESVKKTDEKVVLDESPSSPKPMKKSKIKIQYSDSSSSASSNSTDDERHVKIETNKDIPEEDDDDFKW